MKLTKKYRKEMVRDLLDKYNNHQEFTGEDLVTLMLLTGAEGIVRAWKQPNPKYPSDTRHLYVQFDDETDDEAESWSWVKAIDEPRRVTELKKTLRDAIAPDLKDFMASVENAECERCGKIDRLTVDHVKPPFDEIASDFIKQVGVIEVEHSPDGVGNIIKDIDIEAAWIAFHASHAIYQVLCVSCNASKGKR